MNFKSKMTQKRNKIDKKTSYTNGKNEAFDL